jgi:BlaI family penicillinase repressor
MDALFEMKQATGQEIQARLPGEPSYSTVRTILRVLERKGHVRHIEEGLRYVYLPVVERETAKKSAIQKLIATFFEGSTRAAAAALLDPKEANLSDEDLTELARLIRVAQKERKS